MEESNYIVLLITTGTDKEAQHIAKLLLKQKKAACVNITGVNSLFWWEGNIDSSQERLLIVKTKASLLPEIIDLVKGAHSYTVPEIIALPIVGGNQEYLEWIDKSLT